MSDYKLEPKSIVDELAQFIRQVDGNNKMGAGSLADKICERFHVHSPDVQGEPLAWVTADTVEGHTLNGKPRRIWWENNEGVGMPIYADPQPAEQQPDNRADVRLDKQCRKDVAAALGFIGGGNYAWSYLLQQIKDITSAEGKQPAPDVAGLVGLLEHAQCSNCDGSGVRYDNYGEPEQCQWCHERDAALAAHRQGGDE